METLECHIEVKFPPCVCVSGWVGALGVGGGRGGGREEGRKGGGGGRGKNKTFARGERKQFAISKTKEHTCQWG
jgi:hypothetical protein